MEGAALRHWRQFSSALKRTSPPFVFRLAQGHFQLVRVPDAVNQLAVMTAPLPLFTASLLPLCNMLKVKHLFPYWFDTAP